MKWTYFNEGNLNILFVNPDRTKLLRLPKLNNLNSTLQIYQNYSLFDKFAKYFPATRLIEAQPEWLSLDDSIKPDGYALIMDNILMNTESNVKVSKHISIHHNSDCDKVVIEFKPKWLYHCQTLNCRNCSLNFLKKVNDSLCPLMLLNRCTVRSWCNAVLSSVPSFQWAEPKLIRTLQENDIIRLLYEEQKESSFHNSLLSLKTKEDVSLEIRKRMTLRDVTIFISIEKFTGTCDVKIVDLDLKPAEKYFHWQSVELKLQEFYNKDLGLHCNKDINI